MHIYIKGPLSKAKLALTKQDILQQYYTVNKTAAWQHNIVSCHIERIDQLQNGAWVKFGQGETGFLQLRHKQQLREGQKLWANIDRLPRFEKTFRLQAFKKWLLPWGVWDMDAKGSKEKLKFSKQIRPYDQERLQDELAPLLAALPGVFVIRRLAAHYTNDALKASVKALEGLVQQFDDKPSDASITLSPQEHLPPMLLEISPYINHNTMITTDSRDVETALKEWLNKNIVAEEQPVITYHHGKTDLFEETGVDDQLEVAMSETIALDNGMRLSIEQTKALVSIDIDIAKHNLNRPLKDVALQLNQKALKTIFQQISLRDLGGIIMIDLLKMLPQHHKALLQQVKQLAKADQGNIIAHGITKTGVLELQRHYTSLLLGKK